MMFFSLARNSSCVPLSCGFGLGFILSPQNKIARFRRSPCRNLAISPHKNQQQSHVKMRSYSIFNGGLAAIANPAQPRVAVLLRQRKTPRRKSGRLERTGERGNDLDQPNESISL